MAEESIARRWQDPALAVEAVLSPQERQAVLGYFTRNPRLAGAKVADLLSLADDADALPGQSDLDLDVQLGHQWWKLTTLLADKHDLDEDQVVGLLRMAEAVVHILGSGEPVELTERAAGHMRRSPQ